MGWKEYKVYAIAPLVVMCEEFSNKNNPNVEVVNCAAWNRKEKLYLNQIHVVRLWAERMLKIY